MRRERIERIVRAPRPKVRHPSAEDQLLRLCEELDLADAATAELDVVPGDGNRTMALMRMDLALDRMDLLDRGIVEMAPPDERHDGFQELRTGLRIARTGPRLDKGGALPVLSHAFVVGLCRIGGNRNLRRTGIGPQPQVDAEDIAVGRRLGQQLDDAAHQIDGGPANVLALLEGKSARVVE